MRKKAVSTKDILRVMRKLGFVDRTSKGSHLVLQHLASGLVVAIPVSRSEVPLAILNGIERQMENFQIITREKFEDMI